MKLVLTAEPSPKWHIYALEQREPEAASYAPTLIVIENATGLQIGQTTTEAKPHRHEFSDDVRTYVQHYHEQPVTWTTDITIPKDAKPGDYTIRGIMGFQTCWKEGCDLPQAASFTAMAAASSPLTSTVWTLGVLPSSRVTVQNSPSTGVPASSTATAGVASSITPPPSGVIRKLVSKLVPARLTMITMSSSAIAVKATAASALMAAASLVAKSSRVSLSKTVTEWTLTGPIGLGKDVPSAAFQV